MIVPLAVTPEGSVNVAEIAVEYDVPERRTEIYVLPRVEPTVG